MSKPHNNKDEITPQRRGSKYVSDYVDSDEENCEEGTPLTGKRDPLRCKIPLSAQSKRTTPMIKSVFKNQFECKVNSPRTWEESPDYQPKLKCRYSIEIINMEYSMTNLNKKI